MKLNELYDNPGLCQFGGRRDRRGRGGRGGRGGRRRGSGRRRGLHLGCPDCPRQ